MEAYNKYHEAGKIASQVRESARKKYYVGATLLQICESLEEEIRTRGAMPAFPVNVSLNEIALIIQQNLQMSRWLVTKTS